jgi:hypothetical protein
MELGQHLLDRIAEDRLVRAVLDDLIRSQEA